MHQKRSVIPILLWFPQNGWGLVESHTTSSTPSLSNSRYLSFISVVSKYFPEKESSTIHEFIYNVVQIKSVVRTSVQYPMGKVSIFFNLGSFRFKCRPFISNWLTPFVTLSSYCLHMYLSICLKGVPSDFLKVLPHPLPSRNHSSVSNPPFRPGRKPLLPYRTRFGTSILSCTT